MSLAFKGADACRQRRDAAVVIIDRGLDGSKVGIDLGRHRLGVGAEGVGDRRMGKLEHGLSS